MKKIIFFLMVLVFLIFFGTNKMTEKTVGFDYDSTLSFSTPNFKAERTEDPADRLAWDLINGRLLSLEKRKHIAWLVSLSKLLGYTPIVITARNEVNGDLFRTHVQRTYGVKSEDVYMTKEKAQVLKDRHTIVFFGDSDGDITEAQKAGVTGIRVKRSEDDEYKEHYHPGQYGEFILPLSAAHE